MDPHSLSRLVIIIMPVMSFRNFCWPIGSRGQKINAVEYLKNMLRPLGFEVTQLYVGVPNSFLAVSRNRLELKSFAEAREYIDEYIYLYNYERL